MYEAYYGLQAKPFQLSPDPSFFFGSKGHKRAMSYLEYGLHQGEGFIIVTGEIGAGKTTLVRHMLRKLPADKIVAAHLVSTQLDSDDILRMVAAAFGLPGIEGNKVAVLRRIEDFLRECASKQQRVLLVVDEAQNLAAKAVEELRMLSNFQVGEKPLLQSFLLGQPEFRDTLRGEDLLQLRQRVIASYHLGAMDEAETRAYIEYRLQTAGWQRGVLFTDDAHRAIYQFSRGIPRMINTLCDRLLLMGFLDELQQITGTQVELVIDDMRQEMAFVDPEEAIKPVGGPTRVAANTQLAIELFEERLNKIEDSVSNVLKLSRQILDLASVRRIMEEKH
ncbi:putative secretion ATPase (PEP-CTERM system associated) [Chitinivorax tropicus]|uniref:Putative secretion ATPase (PEP-CTERM system associated) n=1 Tax=Chitinivorax tropicus TaxID=714531 RepID=A0A840MP66_9PROT|nr:XrtA/PEP-CTERM system-associated ATPase [Chitinivorax tropicus]MBB5018879.1 putative secretion ATPase (PEP-CTERM system associated) [Chitinivorax tropicus]